MSIFINTIFVSVIITLIWQVGKYVFLSHFRNANRPKEVECLIPGNSFHDSRPWDRIISQFNLSSSTRGYDQGHDRDRLLARTCRWRWGSMGFGMLFPSSFPIENEMCRKPKCLQMYSDSSLISEFDGNGFSFVPIVELPLADCEETPIKVQNYYLEEVSEKKNILSAGIQVNVSPFILTLSWGCQRD